MPKAAEAFREQAVMNEVGKDEQVDEDLALEQSVTKDVRSRPVGDRGESDEILEEQSKREEGKWEDSVQNDCFLAQGQRVDGLRKNGQE